MQEFFWWGLSVYSVLFVLRMILGLVFWMKQAKQIPAELDERDFSIIQPILSGDRSLKKNLTENLTNSQTAEFIWLIDQSDQVAQQIVAEICAEYPAAQARVRIVVVEEIPAAVNPKVYKLNLAVPLARKYAIILDDDTVLETQRLRTVQTALLESDSLITGIPYYQSAGGCLADLVTAFVNANSLITYLPLALLARPKTINGMCYLTQTSLLKSLAAFKEIESKLCDDYELAKLYRAHKIPLLQSVIPCRVTTEIKNLRHYQQLMKRWMVFTNQFLKQHLSGQIILLIILPSILPSLLLATSCYLGFKYLLFFLGIHFLKAILNRLLRRKLLQNQETLLAIPYEVLSDYLQVFHYLHALVSPHQIKWRNSQVTLEKDSIRFE